MGMATASRDAPIALLAGFLLGTSLQPPPPPPQPGLVPAGMGQEQAPRPATYRDLQRLPGIGPVRARAIVEARHRDGRSRDPAAWLELPGIGPGTLRAVLEALANHGRPPTRP